MKNVMSCLIAVFVFLGLSLAQSIFEVLDQHPQLSQFAAMINASSVFSESWFGQLTNYTLLAPNNEAVTAWQATRVSSNDTDDIMKYHLLSGNYSTANIGTSAIPVISWLTDVDLTNVTDGQRVLAYSNSSGVYFESGVKMSSKAITTNIHGNNSIIHIVDQVLTVPLIFGNTAAETGLVDLIDMLTQMDYVQGTGAAKIRASRRNSTFFAPNSAVALTHVPQNQQQSVYDSLIDYHIVDELVYSSDFKDGLVLPTFNGSTIELRIDANGQVWANNARIIATNYLVYNGVMHVVDDLLTIGNVTNIATASATPIATASASSNSALTIHDTMSMSAKAGIGIGCSSFLVIAIAASYFLLRRRRITLATSTKAVTESDGDCSLRDLRPETGTAHSERSQTSRTDIVTPEDPGGEWEQEPKTLLGIGDLEPKSLWIKRGQLGNGT